MSSQGGKRTKQIISIAVILLVCAAGGFLVLRYGDSLLQYASDPEALRQWVQANSAVSRFAMLGLMMLKTMIPILPGEPLEIAAGYAFGAVEGTLLCAVGALAGSLVVFGFVRKVGVRVVELFFSRERLLSLRFLQNEQRLFAILFFVFLIPGTPKDLLGFFVGLTDMKLRSWMLISGVARLPSIIISTVGGNALGVQHYTFAIVVFVLSLAFSGIGFLLYRRYVKTHKEK